jgi:hypothetical protein
MTPLPQPYFYYLQTDGGRGLAFVDYKGQLAELSYVFPLGSSQTQQFVTGMIGVGVSLPSNATISQYSPGQLSYQISSNGMNWSDPVSLSAGYHAIPVTCPEGLCYVRFSGTRAVLESFSVSLSSPSVTLRVPSNYRTIQAAINAVRDGAVIEVAPGTYSGDIEFHGKAITVRSSAGPQSTIIDCTGGRRGFYFHEGEGSDSVLDGFTIQSGRASGAEVPAGLPPATTGATLPIGGGIYCEFSSPTIANCIIRNCSASFGGGIGVAEAQPVISGCTITGCSAVRGAGIALLAQSDAIITDCVVENNTATGTSYGAGLYCWESAAVVGGSRIANNGTTGRLIGGGAYCAGRSTDIVFQNSLIVGNSANVGSGVFAELSNTGMNSSFGSGLCRTKAVNCTIARNGLIGGGLGGGIYLVGTDALVSNSIVWDCGAVPVVINNPASANPVCYSDIEGGYTGQGNMSQDPLFASVSDFHLQSSQGRYNSQLGFWVTDSASSPCIDAGDPAGSAAVEPAPNGDRVNLGAYGASPQASKGTSHTIYHVALYGSDSSSGLSEDRPFKTIRKAVSMARSGDTILVWPGTYSLSRSEEVVLSGKAITIQSAADAAIIMAPDGYAFSYYYSESSKSVLSNLIIKGCGEGAIFCEGASPTLRNLTVVSNSLGVYAQSGASPNIVNCIFWDNASGDLFQCSASYSRLQQYPSNKTPGNITSDPLFADPVNSDYHLRSQYGRYAPSADMWVIDAVTSPCIDAGDPADYPRAETMQHGERVNMGAFGGTPYASRSNWPPY